MNLSDFRHLFDYGFWASERLLRAAAELPSEQWSRDLGSSFPSLQATFGHLIGAEWIWLLRWQDRGPDSRPAWADSPGVDVLHRMLGEVHGDRRRFLDTLEDADLTRVTRFRLLSGEPAAQRLDQLMLHTVNHSTHHRGQVTTMMRQLGATPPGTDLYVFTRDTAPTPPVA